MMKSVNSTSSWPFILWLLGSVCTVITLPWILVTLLDVWKTKCLKNKLKGQVVLITGASSGLGEALAYQFYEAGCKIILASRRREELERVKNSLLSNCKRDPVCPPTVLPLDVADLNSIPGFIESVLNIYGSVDIIVNNAGITYRGEIVDTNIDVHLKVMMVNYFGSLALTKAILPSMISHRNGHIVMVSSVQGRLSIPFRSAYAASKHALQAFSDCLRAEVAHHNINVTVASPGYINTPLSQNAVTASGETYGEVDAETAAGYSSQFVAYEILRAIVQNKKEIVISPAVPQLAIMLRTLAPNLLFWIMEKRAKKRRT